MTLSDDVRELILELDRVHPEGILDVSVLDRTTLPTFRTSASGEQRNFTLLALSKAASIAESWYQSNNSLHPLLRIEEFTSIVEQAIVDCHVDGDFDLALHQVDHCKKALRKRTDKAVAELQVVFTHHLPAWTLGIEATKAFHIGPVEFLTRDHWLSSTDLPMLPISSNVPVEPVEIGAWYGRLWIWTKGFVKRLRKILSRRKARPEPVPTSKVHDWVYTGTEETPSVLKVEVTGSELTLSKLRARFACRTALDSVALLFNDGKYHRQFALRDEPLQPKAIFSFVETNQKLWFPGSSLQLRGWTGSATRANEVVTNGQHLIDACGEIIEALLNHRSSAKSQLAQRWAAALSWVGDGCRELEDAKAVAKIVAGLDILAGVGFEVGIRKMLLHLTRSKATDIIVPAMGLTFERVVEQIYSFGRSQIIHGNHVDPMKRFDNERVWSSLLARIALRECALRWVAYTGPDDPRAFQSMPPLPK